MKTFVKLMSLLVVLSVLAACTGGAETEAPELDAQEQWLMDNQLGAYYEETQDWANSDLQPGLFAHLPYERLLCCLA